MTLISNWVIQIIIFIIIASIVDLMIPANKMKKYVHLAFGLLLLLIFTKPLLYIFSLDMESEIQKAEMIMYDNNEQLSISNNHLQSQKKEIQAEQNAYILKEVKENLINKANPVLMDKYNSKIVAIHFEFVDEIMDNYENLEHISVTILSLDSNEEKTEIESIVIDTDSLGKRPDDNKITEEIKEQLESIWGLPKEQIIVIWEGGAN